MELILYRLDYLGICVVFIFYMDDNYLFLEVS